MQGFNTFSVITIYLGLNKMSLHLTHTIDSWWHAKLDTLTSFGTISVGKERIYKLMCKIVNVSEAILIWTSCLYNCCIKGHVHTTVETWHYHVNIMVQIYDTDIQNHKIYLYHKNYANHVLENDAHKKKNIWGNNDFRGITEWKVSKNTVELL